MWTVVSDSSKAVVDGMEKIHRIGDVIPTLAACCKHTIEALSNLDIIEVQPGETIRVAVKYKSSLE